MGTTTTRVRGGWGALTSSTSAVGTSNFEQIQLRMCGGKVNTEKGGFWILAAAFFPESVQRERGELNVRFVGAVHGVQSVKCRSTKDPFASWE